MRLLLIFFICLIALPAAAQDYKTVLDLPDGATLVNLSASERLEIEQDLLVATMTYKAENESPKVVQDEINKKMKAAVDKAKKVSSVKASTQQYYVNEYDRNRGKKNFPVDKIWQGRQGLMIKGKTPDDLLKLVGDIQEMGFAMNSLQYQVSPELLEETREAMLEDALEKLMSKAKRTAKAIGKTTADLKTVNVDMGGGGYYPQPKMMRSMAMADGAEAMSAPVAAPGESQITLNVSAQALIK